MNRSDDPTPRRSPPTSNLHGGLEGIQTATNTSPSSEDVTYYGDHHHSDDKMTSDDNLELRLSSVRMRKQDLAPSKESTGRLENGGSQSNAEKGKTSRGETAVIERLQQSNHQHAALQAEGDGKIRNNSAHETSSS